MARKNACAYVFLDSNMLLEFQNFDQIDWPKLMNYQRVDLVIAPIVFTEVDDFKYDQRSERRRERSRVISRKLDDITSAGVPGNSIDIPNRPNVTVRTLTNSPDISAFLGLRTDVNDDHLLASILEFVRDNAAITSSDVFLVSDDTGARNKGRSRGINLFRLDDTFRLPVEPSAVQKELATVKRQLAELQAREPKLSLGVVEAGEFLQRVTRNILILQEPEVSIVEELRQAEEEGTHWEAPKKAFNGEPNDSKDLTGVQSVLRAMVAASQPTYPQEEIERYSKDREQYLKQFTVFLQNSYRWTYLVKRSARLLLTINNDGPVPAQNVIVKLVVPDDLTVNEQGSRLLEMKPTRPTRPAPPRTHGEQLQHTLQSATLGINAALGSMYYPSNAEYDPDSAGPDITPYNSTLLTWDRTKVMHHDPLDLTPIIIGIRSNDQAQEYALKYTVLADNLSTPVEGTISLIVAARVARYEPRSALT